jgi:hypothetical protein
MQQCTSSFHDSIAEAFEEMRQSGGPALTEQPVYLAPTQTISTVRPTGKSYQMSAHCTEVIDDTTIASGKGK